MDEHTGQSVLFSSLHQKPILASFGETESSSDGGLILLKAIDERLRLTERVAACMQDPRDSSRVAHSVLDLVRQRTYGIAMGYPDANDADRLASDPLHNLALGREPAEGVRLASQPTLSRFENSVRSRELVRMTHALADAVIESHRARRRRVRLVTLDVDPTDDPTHGQQPFSFYNGHYDTYCFLPLVVTMTLDDDADQYLLGSMLRRGDVGAESGFEAMLVRLLPKLRRAFPNARIRVRLDGAFSSSTVLDRLDQEKVEYVVGLAGTKPLAEEAGPALLAARQQSEQSKESAQVFGECEHERESWAEPRRVIYKAEVTRLTGRAPRDNVRFVVTSLRLTPEHVYDVYRQRGEMENRIKELKQGLSMDRTSCTSFFANAFRVLLTCAAYVLLQEMRRLAAGTECARAQVWTLRERLLKLAVWVQVSVRRVVLRLPTEFPGRIAWLRIAQRLGAVPG